MISIAIPCYEMKGVGADMLEYSFVSIEKQNYKDFEVVISDHSVDYKIGELCKKWSKRFLINYCRFEEKRGSAVANTNNSIKMCRGDLIKILYQDDYFYDADSLRRTVESFVEGAGWLVSTYIHTRDRDTYFNIHVPHIHDRIHLKNLIGFPSCVTIQNKDVIFFNEDLDWAFDCEYYKRLYIKYGAPVLLEDITVVNYLWEGQLSNSWVNPSQRIREKILIADMYGDILRIDEID
jgi:glycosyltransferase involved in cell wall biosynthesis